MSEVEIKLSYLMLSWVSIISHTTQPLNTPTPPFSPSPSPLTESGVAILHKALHNTNIVHFTESFANG